MVAAPGTAGAKEKVWVAKGKQPQFHDDRAIDQLMAMVVAMTAEISILRERLDTHERLAAAKGVFTPPEVDEFLPGPDAMKERSAQRTRLMRKVFRVLKEDLARYDVKVDDAKFEKVIGEINEG
jgi:hypothetical protein